jgi:hypothetical protein
LETGKGPVDGYVGYQKKKRIHEMGVESEALVPFLRWLDHERRSQEDPLRICYHATTYQHPCSVDANFKTTEGLYATPGFLSGAQWAV